MAIISNASITLIDLNDSISSLTPPANPILGMLWLDISGEVNIMKRWDGTIWVNVGELDPNLSAELNDINQSINNMTSDSIIDLRERQVIKEKLANIIGYVISDTTTTLPTVATMEASLKGEFYQVRESARRSGVLTNNSYYIGLVIEYEALKTYLESLAPIEAWDTGIANRNQAITVDKAVFRDKWMNYYLAVDALETATNIQIQKNLDGLQVGGRNLIRNSTFNKLTTEGVLFDWTDVNSLWFVLAPEADKPNSNILNLLSTGNTTNVKHSATSNLFNARIGDYFTFSLDYMVGSASGWEIKIPLIIEFMDSDGVVVQSKEVLYTELGQPEIYRDNWYRGVYTTTVTNSTVVKGRIKIVLYKNGEIFIREVQVERGNKMTDYVSAPEDATDQLYILEDRIHEAEQIISNDGIVTTVMDSISFQTQMDAKAGVDAIGDLATKDELGNAVSGLEGQIDSKINAIDFTPYAKQTDLQQTADNIQINIEKGGGVNMLRNSVGFAGMNHWTTTTAIDSIQTDELEVYGIGSGFYSPVGEAGKISQTVSVFAGQAYSLSAYIRKVGDGATNAMATIAIWDNGIRISDIGLGNSLGATNGIQKFSMSYVPTTNSITIEVEAGSAIEATFTGIMLNIGYVPLQWTMATGELYNNNIKMDIDGIQVSKTLNGIEVGRTKITAEKFAGYLDVDNNGVIDESTGSKDEVFRVDKDEFVMKKATVREEITLGNMKLIKVEKGGNNGWAFIPTVG